MSEQSSLLTNIPHYLPQEVFETICRGDNLRIERILSWGQASPEGFWFDQDDNEFVVLIQGRALLRIEGRKEPLRLEPGDYINLAAHVKHRVEWTEPDAVTIWLVIYY
ncbi:MAG TPA: cupin domain-containing protein [Proteobacteria bacterium]|nr:cupin domain-containing protein [Pseudomonadota bacterium]